MNFSPPYEKSKIIYLISVSVLHLTKLRWSDSEISFAVAVELSVVNEFLAFPYTCYKFGPFLSNPNRVRSLA